MPRCAPSCPPRRSFRRKRRPPPWTTLHLPQFARSPLINRGKLFKQTEPLLFVVDAARFPRGVMISGGDETQRSVGKEYVISDQPYSFIPFSGNPRARLEGAGSVAGPFYLRFGPAEA